MSSEYQQSPRFGGLPVELLERVVEEILTPKGLANFASTCSTASAIVERSPLRYYLTDLRLLQLRRSKPRIASQYPPTLPSLINTIQHEDFPKFKVVFKLFQRSLSKKLIDKWPKGKNGELLSPTPLDAAISANRFDVFFYLFTSGCGMTLEEYWTFMRHPFYSMTIERLAELRVTFGSVVNYSRSLARVHRVWWSLDR